MFSSAQAIPDGMVIMHSCDNRKCTNPSHLRLGLPKDNVVDAASKGRMARGEKNGGGRKLTEEAVREILATKGMVGSTTMGRKFGVDRHTVQVIRAGKIWKHVQL
jgi:hypothetical protein